MENRNDLQEVINERTDLMRAVEALLGVPDLPWSGVERRDLDENSFQESTNFQRRASDR